MNRRSKQAEGLVYWNPCVPLGSFSPAVSNRAHPRCDWTSVSWEGTIFGNAVPSFNGSTSYGLIADDPIFDFNSDFTVCCWMRATNVNGVTQSVVTKYRAANNTREWLLGLSDGTGQLLVQFGDPVDGTFQSQFKSSQLLVSSSVWHHVGFQQNGTSCDCFVDGQFVNTTNTFGTPLSTVFNGAARVLIGGSDAGATPSSLFSGQVVDVRIYSPRTTAISEMYNPNTRWDLYQSTDPRFRSFLSTVSTSSISPWFFRDKAMSNPVRNVLANTATAAHRRVFFDLRDASDGISAETGEAAGQPQISTNGAAWTNTGISTLTAIGNGRYYAELTQTAVATAGDWIDTRYKSGNTAETPGTSVQVIAINQNIAPGSNGGFPTVDANNAVKIQDGTGANQISLTNGLVTLAGVTHNGATIPTVTEVSQLGTQAKADVQNEVGLELVQRGLHLLGLAFVSGTVTDASPQVTDFDGDSGLSATDDFYNGRALAFTSGSLQGISRFVSDYTGSSKNFVFADGGFPSAPSNGDAFIVIGGSS